MTEQAPRGGRSEDDTKEPVREYEEKNGADDSPAPLPRNCTGREASKCAHVCLLANEMRQKRLTQPSLLQEMYAGKVKRRWMMGEMDLMTEPRRHFRVLQ
jgi:hypothetical protein